MGTDTSKRLVLTEVTDEFDLQRGIWPSVDPAWKMTSGESSDWPRAEELGAGFPI